MTISCQMPHETFVEQYIETRDVPSPLSPFLNAKMEAKYIAQKNRKKSTVFYLLISHQLTLFVIVFSG